MVSNVQIKLRAPQHDGAHGSTKELEVLIGLGVSASTLCAFDSCPPTVTSSAGVAPALPLSIADAFDVSNDARTVRACYEVRLYAFSGTAPGKSGRCAAATSNAYPWLISFRDC